MVERFAGHVYRAFWCAALDFAVLWPIQVVTSEQEELGIFGDILQAVYFNPSDSSFLRYRRWMQLFVVQGSQSPFPTGTPSLLGDLSTCAAFAQVISYTCVIQLVVDINAGLKMLQETAEIEADVVLEDLEEAERPFENSFRGGIRRLINAKTLNNFKDLGIGAHRRLLIMCLGDLGMLCRCLADMFGIMSTYLECMAVGALVTGCVNAYHNTDPFWRSCVFTAGAIIVPTTVAAYLLGYAQEVWDNEDARLRRRRRQQIKEITTARYQAQLQQGRQDAAVLDDAFWRRRGADQLLEHRLMRAKAEYNAGVRRGGVNLQRLQQIRIAARDRALDDWEQGEVLAGGIVRVPRRPLAQRMLLRLPRIGHRLPELPDLRDVLEMVFLWAIKEAWLMRLAWLAVELAHLKLPPWRWLARRRWLCPEFAAMWSEDARRDFYAFVLAGNQLSAGVGAFMVGKRALRQSDYEDLWRRAGLTRDLVLDGGEAPAAAATGGGGGGGGMQWIPAAWDLPTRNLPNLMSSPLVCKLQVCFGVCVVGGAIVAIVALCSSWQRKERRRRTRRRNNV